jgi:lambda family phage portal protein
VRIVSPVRAARRAHARRLEQNPEYAAVWAAVQRAATGYKAARVGDTTTPWAATSTQDADSEILHDLPALRTRSRQLSRDDAVGSGILDEFVRGVVGSGLAPQARTDDLEKNRRIEEVFRELSEDLAPADSLTYPALQRMRLRKWLEDGDLLIKRSIFSGADRMQTESIEADRLGSPFAPQAAPGIPTKLGDGGSILAGVERDAQSRVVAYHVNKAHPGSTLLFNRTKFEFVRVPAEECYFLKLTDRPGQTRGVPLLHAVLQDLRDLDLLMEASLKRTQVAACLAAFIESSADTAAMFEATSQNEGGYVLDQDIRPSMLMKLFPGEKVTTLVPNFPTPELTKFIQTIAQRVGTALGVSWATILHDWHDFTYSGARTQILADRPTWAILRSEFVAYLEWERFHVLEDALLRGEPRLAGVTVDDLRAVETVADPEPWVDPLKEAQAVQVQIEAGLTCLRDEVS